MSVHNQWGTCIHNILANLCVIWLLNMLALAQAWIGEPCGSVTINPVTTICCNGLVYIRAGVSPSCCGSLAYDNQYHMCCDNRSVQPRSGTQPKCCGTSGYDSSTASCIQGDVRHRTDLGSTCCNTDHGPRCCRFGEGCCLSGSGSIDIPGFKPVCCDIISTNAKAQCCSSTMQKTGVLPYCCDHDRFRPTCCTSDANAFICCRATIGIPSCCKTEPRYTTSTPRPVYGRTSRPSHIRPTPPTYSCCDHPNPQTWCCEGYVPVPATTQPPYSCCDHPNPQKWCCSSHVPTHAPTQPEYSCCDHPNPQRWCCPSYVEPTITAPDPYRHRAPCCRRSSTCCSQWRRPCCSVRVNCCVVRDPLHHQSCCNSAGPRPSCCKTKHSPSVTPSRQSRPSCCGFSFFAFSICCRHPSATEPLCCPRYNRNSQQNTGTDLVTEFDHSSRYDQNIADIANSNERSESRGTNHHRNEYDSRYHSENVNSRADSQGGDELVALSSDSVPLSCCQSSYREDCCYSGVQLGVTPDCCDSNDLLRSEGFQPVGSAVSSDDHVTPARNKREAICSGRNYDVSKFICCHGIKRPKRGARSSCCGIIPYDISIYKCCKGTVKRNCIR